MSKFNQTVVRPTTKTTNLAGGEAFSMTNELALVSLLLTSFVKDEFYKTAESSLDDLRKLVSKIEDKQFIAKAAIYARDKLGMRSISHALAAELTSEVGGKEWSKNFYDKIIVRVDDMMEILSYYIAYKTNKDNPKFPNSLKKGFSKAFNKFDSYQLAKYKGEDKSIKLVDIVNIVHPIPSEKNVDALSKLIKGELKSTDTWEAKLSQAGQVAESDEDLARLKSNAWSELIRENKLGYFAALRNIRNIINQSPESIPGLCELLTNEKMIKNSRVLPFRFTTAYEEISKIGSSKEVRDVLIAINKALEISVNNVPKFDGDTLVVVDVSSSMTGNPAKIASLFAAILAKANNCDVMTFERHAGYRLYNPMDSVISIRDSFKFTGGGTNFHSIFQVANRKYDRIIILSDMQGWIGQYSPVAEFAQYKNKYNANPYIYSWDLKGYGTLQFPESSIFCLAGFSEKVFDVMKIMETDKKALIKAINSIEL